MKERKKTSRFPLKISVSNKKKFTPEYSLFQKERRISGKLNPFMRGRSFLWFGKGLNFQNSSYCSFEFWKTRHDLMVSFGKQARSALVNDYLRSMTLCGATLIFFVCIMQWIHVWWSAVCKSKYIRGKITGFLLETTRVFFKIYLVIEVVICRVFKTEDHQVYVCQYTTSVHIQLKCWSSVL